MKLSRLYRRATKKPLKVYWWRYQYPDKLNFGDEITPYIIEGIFNIPVTWADPSTCDLIGAGSIIEAVQSLKKDNSIHVWGSGFIKPGNKDLDKGLLYSAVRGKLSLSRTIDQSCATGDPGLLFPLVHRGSTTKKFKLGIIPHYVDKESKVVASLASRDDVMVIDVLETPQKVADDITSCELIFSSSLHGLIFSDAYGVPNYWTPFSDKLTGGDYKFNDYYSVFNQPAKPLILTFDKAPDVDKLINTYKPKSNLRDVQNSLISSFPF